MVFIWSWHEEVGTAFKAKTPAMIESGAASGKDELVPYTCVRPER